MKTIWIFSNSIAVVTTLVCMSYLYYACRPVPRRRLPVFSILVIGVTGIISGLQFVYPELLAVLQRNPEAIRAGELWRMVTALFVQPNGIGQCLANRLGPFQHHHMPGIRNDYQARIRDTRRQILRLGSNVQ